MKNISDSHHLTKHAAVKEIVNKQFVMFSRFVIDGGSLLRLMPLREFCVRRKCPPSLSTLQTPFITARSEKTWSDR